MKLRLLGEMLDDGGSRTLSSDRVRIETTLRDEGWAVQPGSPHRDEAGLWTCTLVLADGDSDMIHAVTGQGLTAEAARDKATELANRWRGLKAAERSRGKGGGGRWIR